MEVHITLLGAPKEIAALALELQERQEVDTADLAANVSCLIQQNLAEPQPRLQ